MAASTIPDFLPSHPPHSFHAPFSFINPSTTTTTAMIAHTQAATAREVPYFYHELADASWKGKLRGAGAHGAAAAGTVNEAAAAAAGATHGAAAAVVGDENFGLVSGDRKMDKGLLDAL